MLAPPPSSLPVVIHESSCASTLAELTHDRDVFAASSLLVELAEKGGKLTDAPSKDDRRERLSFEKSSVANNF